MTYLLNTVAALIEFLLVLTELVIRIALPIIGIIVPVGVIVFLILWKSGQL